MRNDYKNFLNPGLTGTSLSLVISDMFTTKWMEWSPSVLMSEIYNETGVYISSAVSDKLQAVSVLHTTDSFENQLEAFVAICRVLNDLPVKDNKFTPAEIDSLLIGCTEAGLNMGEKAEPNAYIRYYTGTVLEMFGIYDPPAVLSFAEYPVGIQERLKQIRVGGEYADKSFWIQQKEQKQAFEQDSIRHIQRIIEEVENLPVEVDIKAVNDLKKSTQDLLD